VHFQVQVKTVEIVEQIMSVLIENYFDQLISDHDRQLFLIVLFLVLDFD